MKILIFFEEFKNDSTLENLNSSHNSLQANTSYLDCRGKKVRFIIYALKNTVITKRRENIVYKEKHVYINLFKILF